MKYEQLRDGKMIDPKTIDSASKVFGGMTLSEYKDQQSIISRIAESKEIHEKRLKKFGKNVLRWKKSLKLVFGKIL